MVMVVSKSNMGKDIINKDRSSKIKKKIRYVCRSERLGRRGYKLIVIIFRKRYRISPYFIRKQREDLLTNLHVT